MFERIAHTVQFHGFLFWMHRHDSPPSEPSRSQSPMSVNSANGDRFIVHTQSRRTQSLFGGSKPAAGHGYPLLNLQSAAPEVTAA